MCHTPSGSPFNRESECHSRDWCQQYNIASSKKGHLLCSRRSGTQPEGGAPASCIFWTMLQHCRGLSWRSVVWSDSTPIGDIFSIFDRFRRQSDIIEMSVRPPCDSNELRLLFRNLILCRRMQYNRKCRYPMFKSICLGELPFRTFSKRSR